MRRLIFTLFSLISLFLCVCSAGLWFRQRYESDTVTWRRSSDAPLPNAPGRVTAWTLFSGSGGLRLCIEKHVFDFDDSYNGDYTYPRWWNKGGNRGGFLYQVSSPHEYYRYGLYGGNALTQYAYPGLIKLGFDLSAGNETGYRSSRDKVILIGCPAWFTMAIFAILPIAWEVRHRHLFKRRQRAKRGLCSNCGYDLRASTERCPECGTMVSYLRS